MRLSLAPDTSLRTRLVAVASLLLAAMALFLLWFFPMRMERMSARWLERRATTMATMLASSVAPGIEFKDDVLIAERLSVLAATPEVEFAQVSGADGNVLGIWKPEHFKAIVSPSPNELYVETQQDTVFVVQPIRTEAGDRGSLTLAVRALDVQAERRDYQLSVGAVSLGLLVLGTLATFILGSLMVAPIRRLTEVSLQISQGDLAGAEVSLGGAESVEWMARSASARRKNEVQQLRASFARMLQSLKQSSSLLRDVTSALMASVDNINGVAAGQGETIRLQASALAQTQSTAKELERSSSIAAENARKVMEDAERAERIGEEGDSAIQQTMAGLNEIRTRVEDIAQKIGELSDRAQEIDGITGTVTELADQSHMLALNAAIEAARSGNEGSGFAVVASEIRNLADQSIQATTQVRSIISAMERAVKASVEITDEGTRGIENNLSQVRTSGENLKALSGMVKGNASSMREVVMAVSQQNDGFSRMHQALTELNQMMEHTVGNIDATQQESVKLGRVADQIRELVRRYQL